MVTNRRDFLRMAGRGVLILGVVHVFGACAGIIREEMTPERLQGVNVAGLETGMAQILYLASLAPSGHNMQPWYIRRIKPYEYAVGLDKARLLPAVDPENKEAIMSIGAFAENLCQAASSLGFEATVEAAGARTSDEDLLKVTLAKTKPSGFPISRITMRRTVKKGYLPTSLSADHAKALSSLWPGHIHYFDRNSKHAKCLADWAAESFRHQTSRYDAQRELANCIRFSRSDALKHRYGLTTDGMEITGVTGWYVRNFMGPEDVMGQTFRSRGIELNTELAKQGAGWMIITGDGGSVADLIETGRRFERMALMVREIGIAIHPMTQILEEKQWRDRYDSLHKSSMVPQLVLRVGYLDSYPDPVSLRMPVESFLRA